MKVTGRNLADPSEAYYFAVTGRPKAEQIANGFRFTITNNDTRLLGIPGEFKKGDTIVVSFDEKKLSGTANRIAIYFPGLNTYLQKNKPHVMEGDAQFVGIYIDADTVGEFDVTNFRVTRNVDDGYKPYTSQSQSFTLPAEHPYLAKLPDGTADEIVVDKDGNVELVARVGRDDNVRNVKYVSVGKYYELSIKLPAFANAASLTSTSALCSVVQSLSYSTTGIYRTWTGVYVKDTSGHTKEEIQAEVDKNAPLTVFAPIPETRYAIGKIEMPKAQDSIINVRTDAEVTPRTSIEYTRDVIIVVANLEAAIASIS